METYFDIFFLDIQQHPKKFKGIKFALQKISYYEHMWIICVDL